MRALGQNITDRDAMRLALNSSIIDSQVCVCAHACVRACVYVCMHASDVERVAMDPSGWAAGLTYAKVSKEACLNGKRDSLRSKRGLRMHLQT